MISDTDPTVLPFVVRVLERDGAAVEQVAPEALFVVLPEALGAALEVPATSTLDLSARPAGGHLPFPLDGAGMQWLIDRARARGRRAGARLAAPPQNPSGRLAKARSRLVLPNAKIAREEATRPIVTRLVMEFGYEAQCEDRLEGRVHVALRPDGGVLAPGLADALHAALCGAEPETPAIDEALIRCAVERAGPRVEAEVARELAPFCEESRLRMEAERARIVAYHDHLAREARKRRRGRGADVTSLDAKREAILRQRAERLDDLAERHAVVATHWLASVLAVRYEIVLCRFRIRRRRRELDVDVEWDPYLGEFLWPACDACGAGSPWLRVCDGEGHVTCDRCAGPCEACGRTPCRACPGGACACDRDGTSRQGRSSR